MPCSPQANASVRVAADQPRLVGLGDESAAGAANRGPVAVLHFDLSSVAGNGTNTIDIDVANRSFDANGTALTALVPLQGANGQSRSSAASCATSPMPPPWLGRTRCRSGPRPDRNRSARLQSDSIVG